MMVNLVCIVEGHGDVKAVPLLVRRIGEEFDPGININIPNPIRTPKSMLLKEHELKRRVELAARKAGAKGGILILLDSDEDCPAELGPQLLKWAREARGDFPMSVVLAKTEFESWFLAAAESLRGKRGLARDVTAPSDPEAIRGAKEWLSWRMAQPYSETVDQPAYTALFDLNAARRADSFDKCYREVQRLLACLREK